MDGLSYLNSLEPWSGQGKFSLEPIRKVLSYLNDPQEQYPSVHVAGTNGKGSVAATLSSIFSSAGRASGLTISPHVLRVTERISVDGKEITEDELAAVGNVIREASKSVGCTLTFHEALTAAAFVYFAEKKVDISVIEVGLGGRLDSSNVLYRPEVSVITSIGFDHMAMLGDTIDQIALEKAGIIKGYSKIVVGKLPLEAIEVVSKRCLEKRSVLSKYGVDFCVQGTGGKVTYVDEDSTFELGLKLQGPHQRINAAVACRVARILGFPEKSCVQGVAEVEWPCRLEYRRIGNRNVLFDCAHNVQGVEAFVDYVRERSLVPIRIIFGVLDTKDWRGMVDLLRDIACSWYLLEPSSSRAIPNSTLRDYLSCLGVKDTQSFDSSEDLVQHLRSLSPTDTVHISAVGSIYMLANLLKEEES